MDLRSSTLNECMQSVLKSIVPSLPEVIACYNRGLHSLRLRAPVEVPLTGGGIRYCGLGHDPSGTG